MTAKRFDYTAYDDGTESIYDRKKDKYYFDMQLSEIEELMNELAEENEQLKQSNEDARQILKKEFDFATEQRQKHLDDPIVANAYDIIRYDIRRALDKLGGYDD